jgi:signal transduction histidine kinase
VEHLITKEIKKGQSLASLGQAGSRAWYTRLSEATVWIIVITILISVRFLTAKIFDDITTIWIIGLVLAFALLYYTVITEHFEDDQRHYIKDIADVVFIGILGTVAKDYSIYLFSLYILPIAAAAFALNILNSLVIATIASLFIAGNVLLNSTLAGVEPVYFGTFQIGLLVLLTLFTRALALQLRAEQGERQFFETQLRQVDQKLQDVEAIEQEFVSITTHQLNTPLSIIRGYTSMLTEGDAGPLNEKQTRYVTEIHAGSLRLTKIIRDLLAITHLDRDQFLAHNHQPVVLNDIIPSIVNTLQQKASKNNIKVELKPMTEKLVVMGNDTHLGEALSNLIDNAIKYTNSAGTITVSLEKIKSSVGSDVLISVADNGIGIPADEQVRIFQRFYRASNSKPKDANGTGLGLYIVKRIIEYHGGSISFVSALNQGTTFKIRLPLVTLKGA